MSMELQTWSPERISLIQRTIAPTVTKDEFDMFIERCKQTGLDPIARQIYAISRYDKQVGGNKMTIQVSIDGMRLLAERSGKYAGQVGPLWCDENMEWKEVWLSSKPPLAAKVGVIRSDFKEPLFATAKYSSYVQTKSDGSAMGLWAKMPDLMLAKCAESLALRRAFPAETSGFYTREEMGQAENEVVEGEVHEVAQADAPATDQQLASIRKLHQHLGKPEFENAEQIGYLQAKAMIESLSKEYRESREKPAQPQKPITNGDGSVAKPALDAQSLYTKGWRLKLWKDAAGFHQQASSILGKLVNAESVKSLSQAELEDIDAAIEAEAKAATSGK